LAGLQFGPDLTAEGLAVLFSREVAISKLLNDCFIQQFKTLVLTCQYFSSPLLLFFDLSTNNWRCGRMIRQADWSQRGPKVRHSRALSEDKPLVFPAVSLVTIFYCWTPWSKPVG
jgi:hypothetical protein